MLTSVFAQSSKVLSCASLARRSFYVPATSASSKRVFSKSYIVAEIAEISSKTLEMKTFLKSNYDFIENPIPVSKIAEISCKK